MHDIDYDCSQLQYANAQEAHQVIEDMLNNTPQFEEVLAILRQAHTRLEVFVSEAHYPDHLSEDYYRG